MTAPRSTEVPVRPASTLLLLADRPGLQVLMLKRNERSVFVGDMWVFPGGAVDPEDGLGEVHRAVDGIDDAQASDSLGMASGGLDYWVAAVRETFEEAGVLLARRVGDNDTLDLRPTDAARAYERHREDLNSGRIGFADLLSSEELRLQGGDLTYVSRWITPRGAVRRYDTRFFAAPMPSGQVASHDDDEVVHHEWVSPADALEANGRGEMSMVTPTVAVLQRLASFGSVEDALESAAAGSALDEETVRIRPDVTGPARLAFPHHEDYDAADGRLEHGIVRWPRQARS